MQHRRSTHHGAGGSTRGPGRALRWSAALLVAPVLVACAPDAEDPQDDQTPPGQEQPETQFDTLREAAPEGFYVGSAAAGGGHHLEQDYDDPFTTDEAYREVLAEQFSSLSAENQMKWEFIHPEQGEYDFGPADAIVDFAEENGQVVRGHTLLWHSQNPEWLEEGDFTPEELREILREHIETVVGRYAGRIQQWDVANEIVDDDAEIRTEENIWIRELGIEIVSDAFRWAHEADPEAELFLNDYSVEGINAKSDVYYGLAQDMLDDGVPLHGFGVQGHLSTQYGYPGDLQQNLQRFADLGLKTAITEIDVRIVMPEDGQPDQGAFEQQAAYYRMSLEACLAVEGCDSFTLWGFVDRYSWVPVFFPEEGAATVMEDDYSPRPAFTALLQALEAAR
ncbi:endo-1,4-beta-xylanase [Cellulomonas bogoriensis]|uniref:Beta-xylanase n=1 Tax=Cellulomonas bogoriensis 69B4 = DSM 16987 TaxID=1386082 RepID=A0A0A0C1G3_9CELL|nr:endo-1,4-beta-xylanase [Cellulomonas bogoriensis]KGM14035.1 1,4-beta-xylanase [Cellulomonas bogoriensis 69B4 = DSM 16987]